MPSATPRRRRIDRLRAAIGLGLLGLGACGEVPREPYIDLGAERPAVPPSQRLARGLPEPTAVAGPERPLTDLDLAGCLALAVAHNRGQRQRELAEERARLQRNAAWRQVFDPRLRADYVVREGDNTGEGRLTASAAAYGFTIEPFVEVDYREEDRLAAFDDTYETSVGIAISRPLLRWDEDLRQYLPVSRATRDVHRAVNNRLRELRDLSLAVTRAFYDVQRLQRRIAIREARVADAEEFLADVEQLVPQVKAPVEATNARIDLNRAKADLLREQTAFRNALDGLRDLLGARLDSELSIRAEDVAAWPGTDLQLERDVLVVQNHHERVRDQLLDMEILRQETLVAGDAVLPDLRAELAVQRETEGDDPFDDRLYEDESVTLGFTLDLPLDGQLVERAQYRSNLLQLRSELLGLVDIRRDLARALRRQFRRVQELELQVTLAEERLAAENDKLASSLQRYEDGQLDNLEVTRAKAAAEDAALTLLERRIDRILAVAEYRALIPTPGPTDPVEPVLAPEDGAVP